MIDFSGFNLSKIYCKLCFFFPHVWNNHCTLDSHALLTKNKVKETFVTVWKKRMLSDETEGKGLIFF